MERKYFKCYFCKTGNSYFVPITQKGKKCRCCYTYNYFFTHNNNYHKNNNRRRRNYNYHNMSNNNLMPSSSNTSFFPTANTAFNQTNLFNNRRSNNRLGIDRNIMNRVRNRIRYNEVKKDEKNIIKYSWLKKEELTKEIMEKNKDGYTCSICLENLKIKDDINILKCGHIFHYKCIENLVDHHIKICPNCRSDIKTGEKQPNIQNNDNNLFDFPFYSMRDNFLFDEIDEVDYDPFYDIDYDPFDY